MARRMTSSYRIKAYFVLAVALVADAVLASDLANDLTRYQADCALPPSSLHDEVLCTCNVGCFFVVGCKKEYQDMPTCRSRQDAIDECARRDSCTDLYAFTLPPNATSFPVGHSLTAASRNNLTNGSSDGADGPEPLVSTQPVGSATTTTPSLLNESATALPDSSSERITEISIWVMGIMARLLAAIVFIVLVAILRMKPRRNKLSLGTQDDVEKGMLSGDAKEPAGDDVQLPKGEVTHSPTVGSVNRQATEDIALT